MHKLYPILLGGLSLLTVACNDTDRENLVPKTYRYTATVGSRSTIQVDLPDLSGIVTVDGNPDWFTAEPQTSMRGGVILF